MVGTVDIPDEVEILGRAIDPENGNWSADTARGVLNMSLSEKDIVRMNELAEKARAGTLKPDDEIAIEAYRRAARLLAIMKAKAHLSLRQVADIP